MDEEDYEDEEEEEEGEISWIVVIIVSLIFTVFLISLVTPDRSLRDYYEDTYEEEEEIICSYNAYDCDDFDTCAEVWEVFRACDGDPHNLDADDDYRPCEAICP